MASPWALGAGQVGEHHQRHASHQGRAKTTCLNKPLSLCPMQYWSLSLDHLNLTCSRTHVM